MDPELPRQLQAERWYSAPRLWAKLRKASKVLGKNAVLTILTLYHCLMDSDTPTWARGVIVGALGYLILPADLVPDIIPGAGYGDDWAALVGALGTVTAYVKDIHKVKAAAQTEKLFGRTGR
ncbi:YkvA family protein [Haloferula sp.]|uniref:YkvA family protein n=1 Tax=Haloferula sp. TaxID=2497595 RepID=UPI0032A04560